MDDLYEAFALKLRNTDLRFKRYLFKQINWNKKLVIIKGAKGVGKSTLVLQYVKENYRINQEIIYASLDNIYFSHKSLILFCENFVEQGGKLVILDEIHKYLSWESELTGVLNKFGFLKVVLIAPSLCDFGQVVKQSNSYETYELRGMSYREYIESRLSISLPVVSIEDIFRNHVDFAEEMSKIFDPTVELDSYLKNGYYPFHIANRTEFFDKIAENVEGFLVDDLVFSKGLDFRNVSSLKNVLHVISEHGYLKPNILKLSEITGITRGSVLQYIDYLRQGRLIGVIKAKESEGSPMSKPEIMFLDNSNLLKLLNTSFKDKCLVYKTFILNQLSSLVKVELFETDDFLVAGKYELLVQSDSVHNKQILTDKNRFFVVDSIEIGYKNKLPLWIFGFMY